MARSRLALFFAALTASVVAVALLATAAFSKPASSQAVVRVTVVAREFSFTLSKASALHGSTVIFTVINKGAVVHDFKLVGYKKTPFLQPGQKTTLTVKFAAKKKVAYLCTVPRHAEQGMSGAFVVR